MTPTEAFTLLRSVPACPSHARANMGWCERHREQYCRYAALDCASECPDCAALLVEAVRADVERERDAARATVERMLVVARKAVPAVASLAAMTEGATPELGAQTVLAAVERAAKETP